MAQDFFLFKERWKQSCAARATEFLKLHNPLTESEKLDREIFRVDRDILKTEDMHNPLQKPLRRSIWNGEVSSSDEEHFVYGPEDPNTNFQILDAEHNVMSSKPDAIGTLQCE